MNIIIFKLLWLLYIYEGKITELITKHRSAPGAEFSNQDSHLDDGSGVSDLASVSYGKRVISELQVKLFKVDLDHLERQGMNMSLKVFLWSYISTLTAFATGLLLLPTSEL